MNWISVILVVHKIKCMFRFYIIQRNTVKIPVMCVNTRSICLIFVYCYMLSSSDWWLRLPLVTALVVIIGQCGKLKHKLISQHSFALTPCFSVFFLVFFLLTLPTMTPSSSTADTLRKEHHLMDRDEAWLLPRPCGLSGLLKVKPFTSCHTSLIPWFITNRG